VRETVPAAGLRDFFDSAFRLLPEVIAAPGLAIRGPAFCVYRSEPRELMDLEVGFPVDRVAAPQRGVEPGSLPAGRVARFVHAGGFEGLGGAWNRLYEWIQNNGRSAAPVRWEVYLTRPTPEMDPADLRTELDWLLDEDPAARRSGGSSASSPEKAARAAADRPPPGCSGARVLLRCAGISR